MYKDRGKHKPRGEFYSRKGGRSGYHSQSQEQNFSPQIPSPSKQKIIRIKPLSQVPPMTKEQLLAICLKFISGSSKQFQLPVDSNFLLLQITRTYKTHFEGVRKMIKSINYEWVCEQLKKCFFHQIVSIGSRKGYIFFEKKMSEIQNLIKQYPLDQFASLQMYIDEMEKILHYKPRIMSTFQSEDDDNALS